MCNIFTFPFFPLAKDLKQINPFWGGRAFHILNPDMEKGVDTRTLSMKISENCGNYLIVEDYAPLLSKENLFLVEMFDETFNIWHIYGL